MTKSQMPRATLRWVVDGIEEDIARIVEDGARAFHVPCSLLPVGVSEGQVLAVVREDGGSAGVRLDIAIDVAATVAARAVAQDGTIVLTGRRDEGGDLVL